MAGDTLEQAVVNILVMHGYLRDSELQDMIAYIKGDFPGQGNGPLSTMFRSINLQLRKFSMEVKSIHLTNSNNDRVTYHGIVNTEEDFVSKEFGAPFDAIELKYFAQIANKLLEDKYLSSDDIICLRPMDKIKREQAHAFIAQLEGGGWLRRDDSNYIVLGVRAQLELRAYLEGVVMDSADLEGLGEAERAAKTAQLRALVEEMPQIIVY
jgi:hypothetical protein